MLELKAAARERDQSHEFDIRWKLLGICGETEGGMKVYTKFDSNVYKERPNIVFKDQELCNPHIYDQMAFYLVSKITFSNCRKNLIKYLANNQNIT